MIDSNVIDDAMDRLFSGPDPEDRLTPSAPKVIWLQADPEALDNSELFPADHGGTTWCHDSVGGAEVKYIRADLCAGSTRAASVAYRIRAYLAQIDAHVASREAACLLRDALGVLESPPQIGGQEDAQ